MQLGYIEIKPRELLFSTIDFKARSKFTCCVFFLQKNKTFTGIDFEVKKDITSLRIAGWQQPKDQSFYTNESQFGGLPKRNFVLI